MAEKTLSYSEVMLSLMEQQVQYFRTHFDVFIEKAAAPTKLTRDQKIMVRATGNNEDTKEVCSRGFGKSFLAALCAWAFAVLYPGSRIICVSITANQATIVLQKLKELADSNPNIANEIAAGNARSLIQISKDKAKCTFKNGSTIESFPLDAVRGQRANFTISDEVFGIDQQTLEAVLSPTRNARRKISMDYGFKDVNSKALFITSCCPKSNPFYDSFMLNLKQIARGEKGYFACAFDYKAAISNGITSAEFFEKERTRMPETTFALEYGSIFLGSDDDSAFPYTLVDTCRTLKTVEQEQPKGCKSRYVISTDIATSDAKGSDNTVIVVIKFIEKSDGSFSKKLVYIRSFNGQKLDALTEELRKLYHTKFPLAEKIIFDGRGVADSLPRFFDQEYIDLATGKEYPPLVVDDQPNYNSAALQVLHPVRAVNSLNQRIYTNLRVSLEQQTIELPINARTVRTMEAEKDDKSKLMSREEIAIYEETDALQFEMSNVKGKISSSGNVIYDVWKAGAHKDRYSALAYGNDYICELEKENIKKYKHGDVCVGVVSEFGAMPNKRF